ncbi:MAG TPA: hypothetical protein VMU20_14955, partial [Candidatus Dormibacteraeota bacterium]|nr:hypothetical protein [Candidatus Dormibacteraeota bacterium]
RTAHHAHLDEAVTVARRAGDPGRLCDTLAQRALARLREGDLDGCDADLAGAASVAPDPPRAARAEMLAALALPYSGDAAGSRRRLEALIGTTALPLPDLALGYVGLAEACLVLGDLRAADAYARRAIEAAPPGRWLAASSGETVRARVAAAEGRVVRALEHAERAVTGAAATPLDRHVTSSMTLALVRLRTGDEPGARRLVAAACSGDESCAGRLLIARVLAALGAHAARTARAEQARTDLEDALTVLDALGDAGAVTAVRQALLDLPAGDATRVESLLSADRTLGTRARSSMTFDPIEPYLRWTAGPIERGDVPDPAEPQGLVEGRTDGPPPLVEELGVLLLSAGLTYAALAAVVGPAFGALALGLLAVHELGHWVAARVTGNRASLPAFLGFDGAYVVLARPPRRAAHGIAISLAGPAIGIALGAGLVVAGALRYPASGSTLLLGLGGFSALLNVLNLNPGRLLDGGRTLAMTGAWPRSLAACGVAVAAAALLVGGQGPVPVLLVAGCGAGAVVHLSRARRTPTSIPRPSVSSNARAWGGYTYALLVTVGALSAALGCVRGLEVPAKATFLGGVSARTDALTESSGIAETKCDGGSPTDCEYAMLVVAAQAQDFAADVRGAAVPGSLRTPAHRIAGSYDVVAVAARNAGSALAAGDQDTYDTDRTELDTALGDARAARDDAAGDLVR